MIPAFDQAMLDDWTQRALAHTVYGGADFGECRSTAARITIGDVGSWYHEWSATADRVAAVGADSECKGHRVSAREAFLRAANYYRTSYAMLYGAPTSPLLIEAFDRETAAFQRAAALFDTPVEAVEIPYEGTTLPGYFYRVDGSGRPRPTIIATNGFDSTIQEMHFAHAVAAVRRGYNCLLFDGPGQGRALIKQNVPMRPDWEHVVTPVVDWALGRPEVDGKRVALIGWSYGGYLAPRAASGEHRLAACIADPGQWSELVALRALLTKLGLPPDVVERFPDVDPAQLEPLFAAIDASPQLSWTLKQRGLWVYGVGSLMDYFRLTPRFSLVDHAALITCPTLLTWAESDPVAAYAETLYAALTCPKTLLRFTNAEGAGDHCQMSARTLYHQRSFDWLDELLGVKAP